MFIDYMSSELPILYHDKTFLILEKPAGLPSLSAKKGKEDCETVEGCLHKTHPEARLIHRLDNETSGLMAAALDKATWQHLRTIWPTEKTTKKYLALVLGSPPQEGSVTNPIAHHPRKKTKMIIDEKKGRKAETFFRLLKSYKKCSLLEVGITTGVRHQIRVHLASIGFPIIGDKVYMKKDREKEVGLYGRRHFLHLTFLRFPHPQTGEYGEWHSPLPEDLQEILNSVE